MTDHITIPIDVVEAAVAALSNFVSDHGWTDSDMQAMDNLDAYIARHRANQAARAELAKPTNADPECAESSVDYWQQRGYLGSPGEWREACRLFRVRCSPEDIQRMAKLRAYIEDGLLIVSRPDNKPPTPAPHDAPIRAELAKPEQEESFIPDWANYRQGVADGKAGCPKWHDAPTCAGWWVRNSYEGIGVYSISEPSIKILKGSAARWYGPIPQDGEKS